MAIFNVDGEDFDSEKLPKWAQKLINRLQGEVARTAETLAVSQGAVGESRVFVSNGYDREIKVPEGVVSFKLKSDTIRISIEKVGDREVLHVITDRNAIQVHPWSTNVVKLTSDRSLV